MSILNKLNPRERVIVLGGGALLIVVAVWLYVWQPIVAERAAQSDRIARYLALIHIAETTQDAPVAVQNTPTSTIPLAPRVTKSAEAAGIPLARLDPDGPRLRVTVAKADFAELTAWIADLEATQSMRALSIEMSRMTEPGQVSLRLTLEDAG